MPGVDDPLEERTRFRDVTAVAQQGSLSCDGVGVPGVSHILSLPVSPSGRDA